MKELAIYRHFYILIEQPHSSVMSKVPEMVGLLKAFRMLRVTW